MASLLPVRHYTQDSFCKDSVPTVHVHKLKYTAASTHHICMHTCSLLQDLGNRGIENNVLPCERTMCSGTESEFELD